MHCDIKSICDSVEYSVHAFHHTQVRIFSHNTKVITNDDTVPMMRVFYLIVRLWGWKMTVKSQRQGNLSTNFVAYCSVSILLLYLCQICCIVFLLGCSLFYVLLVPIMYYLPDFLLILFLIVAQKLTCMHDYYQFRLESA